MARRRKNPEWYKNPIVIGVGSFVAGALVTSLAMRKSATKANEIPYYYWVESREKTLADFVGGKRNFTPKIQNSQTGEVFTLPDEFTESAAEDAARTEIRTRGGMPQAGQPTQSISPQAQVQA